MDDVSYEAPQSGRLPRGRSRGGRTLPSKSVDDQHAVHLRMQLRGAALRRAIELVAAGRIDLEGHGERGANHGAVDEHALIEPVEREAVSGAQTVVGGREFDPHDLAALDV